MHRLILEPIRNGLTVDHRDHNGLNNQRDNLREATYSLQNHNRSYKNSIGLRGVKKVGKKFRATIGQEHLGYYFTAEDAHTAYKMRAKEIYGQSN